MNILMVTNEFPPAIGGIQTHVDELSQALAGFGHQLDVVTRHKDCSSAKQEKRGKVCVHRIRLAGNHLVYDRQLLGAVRQLSAERKIEIVHVHGMRPLNVCGKLNIPLIFTNHTSSFLKRIQTGPRQQKKMRKLLSRVSMVIAPSPVLVAATKQTGYDHPVHFISNGVDIERFAPGSESRRKSLGIGHRDFVMLFAGRLHQVKGTDTLAAALEMLNLPGLHLVVAGDGEERDKLAAAADSHLGASRVHMLGSVPNTEMPQVYRAADVVVLPSLMEATSIAGLEAMACGMPLVGSRVGGLPQIIDEGANGLLVPPESPSDLVTAIRTLYSDPELRTRMGRQSRKRVVESFSWEKIAKQTEKHYYRLLAHQ